MKEAGTWMGIEGTVPEFLWNGASHQQRKLMLLSVGITDDDSNQERLLSLRWTGLPHTVQLELFKVGEASANQGASQIAVSPAVGTAEATLHSSSELPDRVEFNNKISNARRTAPVEKDLLTKAIAGDADAQSMICDRRQIVPELN
jgi:hypothetical protein